MKTGVPKWAWAAGAGVAALLAFAWVAATTGPLAPIKVTVVRAATGTVAPTLFGIGTVVARRILNQMAKQYQTAIIVVTHDEKIIPTFRRLYNIRDGRTLEEAGQGRQLGT